MSNKLPSIPSIPPDAQNADILEPMKEIIETGEGVRGGIRDKKVTYQSLLDLGLITESDLPES